MFKEIRYEISKNKPLPSSLSGVWKNESPRDSYDIDTEARILFDYYMYLDHEEYSKHPEYLSDEYDIHSHNLDVVKFGLGSGSFEYKRAREFLYDAIESRDAKNLLPIYVEWFSVLKDYGGGTLEVWGDAQTLKRKTLEEIAFIKTPAGRAMHTATLVEFAGDYIKPDEAHELIDKSAQELLKKLPGTVDFARIASRKEDTGSLGNSIAFVREASQLGFKKEVEGVRKYLTEVLRYFDPATASIFDTRALLRFAGNPDVPKAYRNYFRERVKRAIPIMERGFDGRDSLLGGLAEINLRLGNIKTAYSQLGRINDRLNFLHTAEVFMIERPNDMEIIDALFDEKYLKIVAKDRGRTVQSLRDRGLEHETFTWNLYKIFAAKDLAKKNDFSIFGEGQIIDAISNGDFDTNLPEFAELVDIKKPQSMILELAIVVRIRRILGNSNSEEIDNGKRKNAVNALLILKSKGALP